jgi:hypothetical protein
MDEENLTAVEELMKDAGIPLTRENNLNLAYLGNPPEELGEEEGYLPAWAKKRKKRSL